MSGLRERLDQGVTVTEYTDTEEYEIRRLEYAGHSYDCAYDQVWNGEKCKCNETGLKCKGGGEEECQCEARSSNMALVEPDKDLLAKIAELVEGVDTSMWWYPWLIRRHRYLRRTDYRNRKRPHSSRGRALVKMERVL